MLGALAQLFLVGFCVNLSAWVPGALPGSLVQLVVGFVFSLAMLLFTSVTEPFKHKSSDYFSLLCNFCLVAFLFFCVVLKMGGFAEEVDNLGVLSDELRESYTYSPEQLALVMVSVLLASLFTAAILAVYQMCCSAQAAARMARAEREMKVARGRMSLPPTCDWQLGKGKQFLTFLSHYKVEAGSDARYLSDLIQRMTGCNAYLDSTHLVDLRTLFTRGVHKTDVLVILATKGVFTRPWCVMEMWEAALEQVRHGHNPSRSCTAFPCSCACALADRQVPVILFPVVGGGYTLEDTVHLLSDLEGEMPKHNPACMPEVIFTLTDFTTTACTTTGFTTTACTTTGFTTTGFTTASLTYTSFTTTITTR